MNDPLYEHLKNRLYCREQSLQTTGDVLYGMLNRHTRKNIDGKGIMTRDIDKLEEEFVSEGIYVRQVDLGDGSWVRRTIGTVLAFTKQDDMPVLLHPGFRKYSFTDPYTGEHKTIGRNYSSFTQFFKKEAFTLTYPLPSRQLSLMDIGRIAYAALNKSELIFTAVACIGVMLLNMITPFLNKIIFSDIVPSNDHPQLFPVSVILLSACVGIVLLTATRSLVAFRLKDKVEYELQSGLMARIFSMPTELFNSYTAGELSGRVLSISNFSAQLTDSVLSAILSTLVSGLLGIQLFIYGGSLLWLAILLLLITLAGTFVISYYCMKSFAETLVPYTKMQGLLLCIFSGIQKVKVCGAEVFAFGKWAEIYCKSDYLATEYDVKKAFYTGATFIFFYVVPFVIMVSAYSTSMSVADYISFMAVLTIALQTISSLNQVMSAMSFSVPTLQLSTPILQRQPEEVEGDIIVHDISGSIGINGLSFTYPGTKNRIFDDLNLTIQPGEYVAIVGKSGCGKSTLLRLILGFEKPDSGSIFFDHYNLADVNKSSLRRNCLSICMQNGRIINGTIMENICFTRLDATEEEAWEAARIAALDEDIRHMCDGMQTVIGDNGQEVSGGQCQRILIARAIISQPRILLLDEATSALDNISQKIVTDNLRQMGCTRITIAHRLSTIRDCDRIVVIDNGRVAEDGTFDELMNKGGLFSTLCNMQMPQE